MTTPRRLRRPHRGLFWGAALLAAVITAAGGVLIWSGLDRSTGPDATVLAYFRALQDGDAPAALAFGAQIPSGSHALLTDAALTEQQRIAPIQDVGIVSVGSSNGSVVVNTRYVLAYPGDPQQVTAAIPVEQQGGDWRLRTVAIATALTLPGATDRATLLGAAVPTARTALFPGAVPIRFDTPYLSLDPGRSAVGLDTQSVFVVGVIVTDTGRAAIAAALTSSLTSCLSPAPAATACPLPDARAVPGTVTGSLTGAVAGRVKYAVTSDPAGRIAVSGTVGFTGSYSALDFSNVAQKKTGTFTLPLDADLYAVAPVRLLWGAAS